jgi:hypothetical protein
VDHKKERAAPSALSFVIKNGRKPRSALSVAHKNRLANLNFVLHRLQGQLEILGTRTQEESYES